MNHPLATMTDYPRLRRQVVPLLIALCAASSAIAATPNPAGDFSNTMMPSYEPEAMMYGQPSISNQAPLAQQAWPQQTPQAQWQQQRRLPPPGAKPNKRNPLQSESEEEKLPPFIEYVKVATGNILPVFGADLFDNPPSTFAPSGTAQVNPDYVIGAGDQIQVKGWGMVDIDLTLTVERNGTVYLPRVGAIAVAGVKFRDLQDTLKKSVSRVFHNFDLSASLLQTRAVQVYVVGHARAPGSYTLGGMSTLLNALFAAGGPSDNGSMRHIQLMRDGKAVGQLDLYKILVDGDKSSDLTLRDGDVIQIRPTGKRVALQGDVKHPAIYEFADGDSVADLLHWAGGLESAAEGKAWQLEKSVDNRFEAQWQTSNGQTSPDNAALKRLKLGASDIFRVFAPNALPVNIQQDTEYVRVSGEVKQTGTFLLQKGETLRDLIMRLGGATENGYVFATNLQRENIKKEQQAKLDEVANRFEKELEQASAARLSKQTDKDNVAAITAEVERQRKLAEKMRAIKAEGRVVLELSGSSAQVKDLPDLPLQNGDAVTIPRRPGTVNVLGSVYQSNAFIYRPQRSVKDYLDLAGGISQTGDKSATYVIRADGTVASNNNAGWFNSLGGKRINPGDTIVVPDELAVSSWTQSLKEWTSILYQFGLGAAGLKVLK
ncbi:SLBB domain-containing protein [Chromobacterium haemolyticum]|uniref:SLBB domain-containing protein n=1 Tax=Chromobacterium haemolyticum TaxID=394935 RepID=UPI0002FBA4AA|nr:SLBB domain-containing protein [Chromobacterium haemolyticum]